MRSINKLLAAAAVLSSAYVLSSLRRGSVNRVAGVAALIAAACFTILIAEAAMHRRGTARERRLNVRLLLAVTFACLLCLELGLRFFAPKLGTYLELNGGAYRSQYQADRRRLHLYRPGERIRQGKPEFVHERQANQLGIVDAEIPATKRPGEYRILALGDSFTEGVGAPEDASWLRVMQRAVQARYPSRPIAAINGGVSGSDPFAEYRVLQERLSPLQPDLLIVAMNSSDLNEVMVRGGAERFRPDGSVQFRSGPFWEPVYALSYITRFVMHRALGYDNMLRPSRSMPEEMRNAAEKLAGAMESIRQYCDERGIKLLLVVHPTKWEIIRGSYDPAYDAFARGLERTPGLRVADLLKDFARDGKITPANATEFYWPLDLHHNARGYAVMGDAIARRVIDMGFIDADARQ